MQLSARTGRRVSCSAADTSRSLAGLLNGRPLCARTVLTVRDTPQGNYIGPEDDLESDYSDDEAGEQRQQDGAASPTPAPLRAYDEDEVEPLEGMEVDGKCAWAFLSGLLRRLSPWGEVEGWMRQSLALVGHGATPSECRDSGDAQAGD